ncbi:glycerophosphodiester phosphodiesterase family protein [Vreelandella subglaciescola]|jgi:glycerophosphoryl diester phosphodiesterase|uniref:Glycerophosphoryl diester phosphodiesterase n=1 Tax=Vreelandella subglaciescola TaxID=29571 RepID=A0A1M7EXR2_9GAMM|nr:glycerophosphodiester phosphodiesterase family protein [Halomonas subglaciescola]SHL96377.1 glycerophosphoryl diester phosphodiesterase [Halomonas subglaciescola]
MMPPELPAHPAISVPRVIAHRGYSARAPENTLAAVRAAHQAGVRWVELDVQLLGDGTPVIWHDRDVKRCSNGSSALAALDRESAQRLDVGAWFSAAFQGERMARLEEMLALLNTLNMGLNLELKINKGHDPLALTQRIIPEVLAALPPERLIVSSFSQPALAAARAMAPPQALALGLLAKRLPCDWPHRCNAISAFSVHLDWRYVKAASLAALNRAGVTVMCYTANDPVAFAPRWQWGVSSVISDNPTVFMPPG